MFKYVHLLLQGQLPVLTLISVSVSSRVTAVARDSKSRSFCQKCRWQVTSAHACTLRMWLNLHEVTLNEVCGFVWNNRFHGCMVYTEGAETAAVSRGTSHLTSKQESTSLKWLFKTRYKKRHSFRIACDKSAVSLLERGEQRYMKTILSQSIDHHRSQAKDLLI